MLTFSAPTTTASALMAMLLASAMAISFENQLFFSDSMHLEILMAALFAPLLTSSVGRPYNNFWIMVFQNGRTQKALVQFGRTFAGGIFF